MSSNFYEYGTTPRKYEEETYEEYYKEESSSVNNQVAKPKLDKKSKVKQAVCVFGIFSVLITISYRNSLINENFKEVQNLKAELSEIQKENQQIEVSIEASLNLNNIERVAQEELGMQKQSPNQTKYIDLNKKDYVEAAKEDIIEEEKEETIFQKILNFLKK